MNSLNHYSYGSVVEFLYRYAAGISPTAPGFRKAKIAPLPEIRLGSMECRFDSASGTYVSNWRIKPDGSLCFHIEIPFDCEAEVLLPEQKPKLLLAGSYDFHIRPKRDYLALYSAFTPYERLLADERAIGVLDRYVPEIVSGTDRNDPEAMSKCLNDSKFRAALFRMPTEQFDNAIREIGKIHAMEV